MNESRFKARGCRSTAPTPRLLAAAVLSATTALAIGSPAQAAPLDSYCSPTGDFCLFAKERAGQIKLGIRSFNDLGRYKLCVDPPRQRSQCKKSKLSRRKADIYADTLKLAQVVSSRPAGRYAARWELNGNRLGQPVRFSLRKEKPGVHPGLPLQDGQVRH